MSETPAREAPARETVDQAATRRRWITLAEVVAVSGVLIGALTLWLNWSDKRDAAADKAMAAATASAAEARFALKVTVDDGQVVLSDPTHEIIDTQLTFPSQLGLGAQSPATPRIERDWFDSAVLKATKEGPDSREGRLPVLVSASYRVGDAARQAKAIVDVVWKTHGRLVGGRVLEIEAARVRQIGGDAARVDALWAAEVKRLEVK